MHPHCDRAHPPTIPTTRNVAKFLYQVDCIPAYRHSTGSDTATTASAQKNICILLICASDPVNLCKEALRFLKWYVSNPSMGTPAPVSVGRHCAKATQRTGTSILALRYPAPTMPDMNTRVKGRDACDTPAPVNALLMPLAARRMSPASRSSAYAIPPCMRNHWSSESPSVSSGSSASANSSFSISSNLV